ncbi:germination protein, GerC family [Paenibacillus sp. FSL R7-277]|uniref:Ger(x)C family spore germination protein n=1 Tax=Paenibacillus sp. FSL R7-277 TaxID=1227352 RepID=UPI0003E2965D|nr:Ger(x)C family spore germination protein [Paenibacillus sp. FSL R7-277]ETT57698.1 germination protein, GerC family [Paenibacillus sp. FSL R7-277]
MRRTVILICVLVLMSTPLTGCWSRKELGDLAVAIGLGIDRTDKGYRVTVQIVAPSLAAASSGGAGGPPALVVATESATIMEALRKLTTMLPRKVYLSHLSMLLLDEAMAREGIRKPLDFLFRDHEVRPDFDVAIVREGTAYDALSIMTPLERLPARDLYDSLNGSQKNWAPTSAVRLLDLMKWFDLDGQEAVLTGLHMVGDLEKGKTKENVDSINSPLKFEYRGIGVMKDDVLLGWLNEEDSKAYNYVTGKVKSTVGKVDCPDKDGNFVMEVLDAKTSIKPEVRNGEPSATVKVRIEANVGEVECSLDLNSRKTLEKMKERAIARTEALIVTGIRDVQNRFGVDIFGFGNKFHQKYPRYWHKWQDQWNEKFRRMDVKVVVEYIIKGRGRIVNPPFKEPDE